MFLTATSKGESCWFLGGYNDKGGRRLFRYFLPGITYEMLGSSDVRAAKLARLNSIPARLRGMLAFPGDARAEHVASGSIFSGQLRSLG